ncbi:MAG: 3-oxoadipate enol-lactonase [Pseudomonadota bacterium]
MKPEETVEVDGLHVTLSGPADGPPILFLHAVGTDHRVWDGVKPTLPAGMRTVAMDLRGHGQSTPLMPDRSMADLVADAARVLHALRIEQAMVVGVSLGGMIAQGLAAERPELVRALVLIATGAKIGTPQMWQERVEAIRAGGLDAQADTILARWFSAPFRQAEPEIVASWRERFVSVDQASYCQACLAIGETDLFDSTARLRIPTLGISGTADPSTPPDLVRETVDLIPGSQFALIRGCGHLPPIECPEVVATAISEFIADTGHLLPPGPTPPPRLV